MAESSDIKPPMRSRPIAATKAPDVRSPRIAPTEAALREILNRNRLLAALGDDDVGGFLALSRVRTYDAKQVIFQKGDPGDRLYAILKGKVGISTSSEQGKEIVLNILEPGDVLGEIALLDGKERTAGAAAMEATELLVIERADFLPFLEKRPKLCIKLMGVLCERLRWTSGMIEDTMFLDIPHRLAKRLHTLVGQFGVKGPDGISIDMKLSQESLGQMLGATRESVNKGLRALEERKLIAHKRGRIVVVNVEALIRFVREAETNRP